MAGASLLVLIDDIASVLDDVALMTKVAAKKTAGVLGDDLALNAEQVSGVRAERELPVVWAVAVGSLKNKLILVPTALLISAFIPWAVTPLLMIGGFYLCLEGVEKLAHKWLHPPEEDAALAVELLAYEKERAEHTQLLDLGRNDCGRVAKVGSVKLTENMLIERYSHVMHIVSNVEGKLQAGLDALDVLKATFPAGTVSGAPKVRAMEIIDELEPIKRGIYAGAVGYLGFHGDMDLAIAIRTAVVKDKKLHVQAGAGIVADSDPHSEWIETQTKARAVLRAAELAEQGLDTRVD